MLRQPSLLSSLPPSAGNFVESCPRYDYRSRDRDLMKMIVALKALSIAQGLGTSTREEAGPCHDGSVISRFQVAGRPPTWQPCLLSRFVAALALVRRFSGRSRDLVSDTRPLSSQESSAEIAATLIQYEALAYFANMDRHARTLSRSCFPFGFQEKGEACGGSSWRRA